MADNLKAAALAANLQGEQKKQVDDLVKSLFVHKELSNLPKTAAEAKYAALPDSQKNDLVKKYGTEDPLTKPSRGWLGTAWNYTGGAVVNALTEVSDFTTRAYRAISIPITRGEIGFAWDEANDNGEKVYNEGRIEKARAKYGRDAVDVAVRIKSGEDVGKLFATATPEQQKYIMLLDPLNTVIPGITNVEQSRKLFDDTLAEVDRAKISYGRQLANAILPDSLEKNGLVYNLASGYADAMFLLFVDPLVVTSKIKALYTISKYSLDVMTKGEKVISYFGKPQTAAFWDQYGSVLEKYTRAQKTGASPNELVAARDQLKLLAPEFGPEVIKVLQKSDVVDANSAKAFLMNTEEAIGMLKGAVGRKRVILPRLDTQRKIRIGIVTGANKVISLDKFAPRIMDDLFGPLSDADGIRRNISEEGQAIGAKIKELSNKKAFLREPSAAIGQRLDRFKAKFNIAPMFKDDAFDVMAKDASTQVYRLARLVLPKQDSKMYAETFESIDDVGKRKEMVKGIWDTIAEARGLNLTEAGQKITARNNAKFSISNFGDDFQDIGSIPSDYSNFMTMPSLVDIDRAAARSGLIGRMWGLSNKEWVDKMTGYWSFLTLAGPRYAIRNASEDLMVHLAIGGSPWGLAKGRYLSTRVNTAIEGARASKTWSDNPLGGMLRILNSKEAAKFEKQISGIDGAIVSAREEIKSIREQIKLSTDPIAKASLEARIDELKNVTTVSATEQTRRIMATALTSGRINRYRESLGMKPMFEEEAGIIAEHLIYGNLENSMAIVSEGASNFATGGDFVTRATVFTRSHGVRSEALVIREPKAAKYGVAKADRQYRSRALGNQDEASLLTWLMRINYYANDELGAIAVANLSNTAKGKEAAIIKIMDWMKKNPGFRTEAQLAARNIDEKQHAEIVYNRAAEIFEKRGKSANDVKQVNEELLNKIRITNDQGDNVISGKLSLDDVSNLDDADIPAYVLGPALVPISDSGNVTASLMTKGWTWLGLANARMSRQPMVFNEIVKIRQQMRKSGFEDAYINSVVSKVDQTNPKKIAQATTAAKRQFAQIVEERAVSQIIEYVDNPLVRTQLAFGLRNFSRFYRATEDFYRRMSRVVRYNPMAIRQATLTYDGISHNGFIQEDDQGEKYFVYPGLEPVYRAVQTAMVTLGIPAEFKVPLPVQFGAQVKMLTPSLNADSLMPTFSGPVAGVSMKVITNLVGLKDPGAADHITELTMGKYAVGRSFVSSFLPAHINRLYETMSTDDRDSQYASAWRKAVTYLEAGGHGLPEKYNEFGELIPPSIQEQEEYRQSIKNTTLAILGTRFIYGFFAPASPQVQLKADMAQWVKDNGKANFKQAWNSLLDQYPGDYDAAMTKWVELFPNEIPFTVPESEKKTVAIIKYAEESGTFVEENKDLFARYPQGAAFLIPHKSGFSWDAYKTMRDMGLKYNKRVDDFLREVQTASDLQQYYAKKNEYESSLEGMISDYERTAARQEFQDWSSVFKAGRPLVQEELAEGGKKAIERVRALDDLRNMLNDKSVTVRGPIQKSLKEMLDVYDSYKLQKEALQNVSGTTNLVSFMQDEAIVRLRELAKANENTMSAYNTMFASLIGDTNG